MTDAQTPRNEAAADQEPASPTAATTDLIRATADFLGQFRVTHVATLTTRIDLSEERMHREFLRFRRDLERRSRTRVGWAMVMEYTHVGRVHIHAVLDVQRLSVQEIQRSWQPGFSKIQVFDPERGWLRYFAKEIPRGATWSLGGLIELPEAA